MSSTFIQPALIELAQGRNLSAAHAQGVFEELLSGNVDPAQIGAFLGMLERNGVSADELVGGAISMRRHVTEVPLGDPIRAAAIDTCGTGGAPKLFNVSTLAAIVAAAAGAKVVKHGNRSRTGRGSAEIMQALGVNVEASPAQQARCVEEAGLCFCFAIHHHPATRAVAAVRRALGFPTIFNLLGPLTNPGRATRQLLGVSRPEHVRLVAEALSRLGCTRAMVVHSNEGFDELSITGANLAAHVEGHSVRTVTIDPQQFGFERADRSRLQAETLEEAVEIAQRVLRGEAGPKLEIVLFNAGAALHVAGIAENIREGIDRAREAVAGGSALRTVERLKTVSHAV